jgi:hypothetical protein
MSLTATRLPCARSRARWRIDSGAGQPALDGLRAFAIRFVLLHHTAAFLTQSLAATLFPGGFLGVDPVSGRVSCWGRRGA